MITFILLIKIINNYIQENRLEIIYILLAFLITFLIVKYIKGLDKGSTEISIKTKYPKDSVEILITHFGDKDFYQNINMLELKEKLDIKTTPIHSHDKSLKDLIDKAKYKADIFSAHRAKMNKSYDDFTTLKVTANSVIDYCIKKNINIKGSIRLLFLTFQDPYLQEILDEPKSEYELLDQF